MGTMLSVKDLNVYYGSIHAIKGVSFEVNEGEIVTLIGANGAGKTTTLHAISGLLKPKSGEIAFCGNNLVALEAHKIIGLGLAQVPEGRRIFANMTVMENLQMGAYTRRDTDKISADYDMVFERLPRLKERRKQAAGTLSGGEQQMLAIGRALMCKPKMLLLDEPSMGLFHGLRGNLRGLQMTGRFRRTGILRNSTQILIRKQALRQRRERYHTHTLFLQYRQ